MGAATVCWSVPFGPFTVMAAPAIVTSTPEGTAIGSLPIRDISLSPFRLPDVGEDFPTHALLGGLTVCQQAGGRRDNRDAETAENLRHPRRLRVHAQPGL